MNGLLGKVALCTGSGRAGGLGFGILDRLGQEGCRLVVTDLGNALMTDDGSSFAALKSKGYEVIQIACDVSNENDVVACIDQVIGHFGQIDIVINNAAIGHIMKPLLELDTHDWLKVIGVNLTGAFLFTREAGKRMLPGSSIINIASQAAKTGFRQMAPYVSSKHGLIGLTRTSAIDLASKQIRVNAVCPNHVTTDMGRQQSEYFSQLRGMTPEDYRKSIAERVPLGRVGTPSDTAAAVAFLASDDAAFITGEAMNVSGGEEMH
jgi:meso-butanediol dehydrogenase/(S,S)-butanediol dehydrogenase/diacetyl reductase